MKSPDQNTEAIIDKNTTIEPKNTFFENISISGVFSYTKK
jgi:hypothetical protein